VSENGNLQGGGLRVMVAAFGDPGHAFPAIALARELAARGHEVLVETWERWREDVERAGLAFTGAEEYQVFPPPPPDSRRLRTAADAARSLLPLMEEFDPDVVVSDILTLAPSLAAEAAGKKWATLIPHVYPVQEPGLPFFATGVGPARTPLGRLGWKAWMPLLETGLRRGRRDLNVARAQVGLPPLERFHGGISPDLALVATWPQLEYPREWPASVRITGPLFFEMDHERIELPPGDEPLVLVAPSTAQDRDGRLVRIALEALADEPVRIVATTSGKLKEPVEVPTNAVLADWVSYGQLMPEASVVVCHGGHGTMARALVEGAPVLTCPAAGDMAENAMRAAWAGAGLSLPWRLTHPRPVRWAVRELLGEPGYREKAEGLARWARERPGGERASEEIERYARSPQEDRATA
jgi:UDP:flavonoid glycosyltransferase YjiC (YdhE family)